MTISPSDLAVYRATGDRATAILLDPLGLLLGLITTAVLGAFAYWRADAWTLAAVLGVGALMSIVVTRVDIDRGGVRIHRRHFLFWRDKTAAYDRGRFECADATSWGDEVDTMSRREFTFWRADRRPAPEGWRARNRGHSIEWLNAQLDRFGLLSSPAESGTPARGDHAQT